MKRSTALDYARFPAAIGIIIFHVGAPGANIGYAALPFFCILLVFLAFPAAVKKDFTAYAASRAKRLLQPWAIWSLVYAALKLGEVGVSEARLETEFAAWMLLTGPAIHLWFLPFACAACIAIWPLARLFTMLSETGRSICGLALSGLAALIASINHDVVTIQPFTQWLHVLPAVVLGSAFGFLASGPRYLLRVVSTICITGGFLLVLGWPDGAEQLVIASLSFALCLALPLPDHPIAHRMAGLSLTLYLAHPMVISILLRVTSIPDESLAMAVAAVTATTFLALGLQELQRTFTSR